MNNICVYYSGINAVRFSDEASLELPFQKASNSYESCCSPIKLEDEDELPALPMCHVEIYEHGECAISSPEDAVTVLREGDNLVSSSRVLTESGEIKRTYLSVTGSSPQVSSEHETLLRAQERISAMAGD